jgi:signal transduction histidine kinase
LNTTKAKGTGLGLALVGRIVEAHRGRLAIKSAPGRGTTITVRLPIGG